MTKKAFPLAQNDGIAAPSVQGKRLITMGAEFNDVFLSTAMFVTIRLTNDPLSRAQRQLVFGQNYVPRSNLRRRVP
jgi:hypothetical protein